MMKSLSPLRRLLSAAVLLAILHPAFGQIMKTAKSTTSTATAKPTAAATDDASKLDLNTASADQLKALPGIGDAYTKRIIDGRPYTAKTQLTQKGILPQKTYDGIKDMIVARRATSTKK